MLGKTFFLDRAKSRSLDWIGRYPALGCSSCDPQSLSGGRQIVVAAADDEGVRCAFFSSIGSITFSATWAELSGARQWWHFVGRWYFWMTDCESTLAALRRNGHPESAGYAVGSEAVDRHRDATFLSLLDRIESRARRSLSVCAPQAALETLAE